MPGARHPKPYKEGPRRQITIPWKKRVEAKLAANKEATPRIEPWNIEQLGRLVGAKKAGLNKTFDLKREPQQLTSKYADEICDILGIAPPLIEAESDTEDFIRDVQLLRRLTPEARRDLMLTAQRLLKK